jgi:hypothetical protein
MIVDHVAVLVPDADEAAREVRVRHGLGTSPGSLPLAGTRTRTVWLEPPQYLELHSIEDRAAAEATESGRRVLACEAAGFGMLAWAVLVDDLEAVSRRLGVEIFDYTIPHPDGTLRGWRAVSGPPHLPFFVDYPDNGDRSGRHRAMYVQARHSCAPTRFSELTISGSAAELRDWLGPHDLPLRFVGGTGGLCEARIATSRGEVTVARAARAFGP